MTFRIIFIILRNVTCVHTLKKATPFIINIIDSETTLPTTILV